jgi:hypothetical protein
MLKRVSTIVILMYTLVPAILFAQGEVQPRPLKVFHLDDTGEMTSVAERRLTASVGDSLGNGFVPRFAVSAWEGECGLSIDLDMATVTPVVTADALGDTTVSLQSESIRHDFFRRESSGLEWSIEITNPLKGNSLAFPFESKGFRFHYQDSLTDYERDSLHCARPDSAVGSYAVYRSSGTGDRRSVTGNDTVWSRFGTGKAFHIYRPRAWDNAGDTVWCQLTIDTLASKLTVTIPQSFLDRAVYPVTIDPTFGSTAEGASGLYLSPGHVRHCRFAMGGQVGTLDSITCFVRFDGVTDSLGTAIYADGGGYPGALLATCDGRLLSNDWSVQWYSFPIAGSPALQASTDYWLSLFIQGGGYLRYDDLGEGETDGHFNDPWPPSDPASCGWNPLDYTFSIYATYTVPTTSEQIPRRRRILGDY